MTTDEREDENGAAKDAPADGTADTGGEESGAGASVDAREAGAEDSDADDAPPAAALGTRLLGIERYIQGAYAVLALLLFWVFQQSVVLFWNLFAEPNVFVATAIGAVAALGATVFLYRHERFHQLTREIALELPNASKNQSLDRRGISWATAAGRRAPLGQQARLWQSTLRSTSRRAQNRAFSTATTSRAEHYASARARRHPACATSPRRTCLSTALV